MCTSAVKKVTDYYRDRSSHVFLCFIDFSKAFDRVNYWKLFSQLLDDGIELCFVKLLAFWYSNQTLCVLWQNTVSWHFIIGNGTRQGGILSPYLFTQYVRGLIQSISACRIGCNVAGLPLNIVAYADDMVSWPPLGMQCRNFSILWIATAITLKLPVTLLKPLQKDRVVANECPWFTLGGGKLKFVEQFSHLGHILSNSLNDDDDIKREIQNLYIRTYGGMYLPSYFFLPQQNIFWKIRNSFGPSCNRNHLHNAFTPTVVTPIISDFRFAVKFCCCVNFAVLIYCFHLIICRYRCQVTYRVITRRRSWSFAEYRARQ